MARNARKRMMMAAVLGGMGVAGYMYMKKNPQVMQDMKCMAKNVAKKTYDKLEDVE